VTVPENRPDSQAESEPETVKLGHEWTVTVEANVSEVVFDGPGERSYTVQTVADGHGMRTAVLVLTARGNWTAADGEFAAAVK
jgi:hypothetical protein